MSYPRHTVSRRTAVSVPLAAIASILLGTLLVLNGQASAAGSSAYGPGYPAPNPSAVDGGCNVGYTFDGQATCESGFGAAGYPAPDPSATDGGCYAGFTFDGVGACFPSGGAGGTGADGPTQTVPPPPPDGVPTTTTSHARPSVKVSVATRAAAWVGSPVTVVATARDSQLYPVRFTAHDLPRGLSINPASGAITGKATVAEAVTSTVTASDAYGGTGAAKLTWTVREHKLVVATHVSGAHVVGHTLALIHGAFHRDSVTGRKVSGVKVTYRWFVGGKAIKGASRSTLRVTDSYRHHTVSVRITATKHNMAPYVRIAGVKIV